MFEDKETFHSIIINITNEMKAIISSLNNLNISSDILIEINDIDLDATPDPNDLCDYYDGELL